jgi:hypothetical protein
VKIRAWHCHRCGYDWVRQDIHDPSPPKTCARCKSPYWRTAPTMPQRRPKKYRPVDTGPPDRPPESDE